MLDFIRPGFLVAGALASLLPLALHFIRREQGEPNPLPTARFLERSPEERLRVKRRPDDLVTLLLRLLFVLLLAALFAGARWLPMGEGVTQVVVLDEGRGMVGWNGEAHLSEYPDARVVRVGSPLQETSIVEMLDGLREGAARARSPRVRGAVISRFREGSWSQELFSARDSLWPGVLDWWEVVGPHQPPTPVHLYAPAETVELLSSPESALILPDGIELEELGPATAPWSGNAPVPEQPALLALLTAEGLHAFGAWEAVPGTPDGAHEVPLRWEGGRPASAVRWGSEGEPCHAVLGVRLLAVDPHPDWPRMVARLLDACLPPEARPSLNPGDPVAQWLVRGRAPLPAEVTVAELDLADAGIPLDRALLALLLLLGVGEAVRNWKRKT